MSQRFKVAENENDSKPTRLDIAGEFSGYRFGRDELAHVSRYLLIVNRFIVGGAKDRGRPLSVLDVGCGDLYILRTLVASSRAKKADVCRRYVGVDLDNVILERAAETLPGCVPVELLCGDVTTGVLGGFKDGEFDLVVCTEVVEHLQPRFVPPFLAELARVSGGEVVVSTPNWTGGSGRLPEDHVKEWDAGELMAAMRRSGLDVLETVGIFCNLPRARKLAKKDQRIAGLLAFLEPRMDPHFLSITMARFLGTQAQNVLYRCRPATPRRPADPKAG